MSRLKWQQLEVGRADRRFPPDRLGANCCSIRQFSAWLRMGTSPTPTRTEGDPRLSGGNPRQTKPTDTRSKACEQGLRNSRSATATIRNVATFSTAPTNRTSTGSLPLYTRLNVGLSRISLDFLPTHNPASRGSCQRSELRIQRSELGEQSIRPRERLTYSPKRSTYSST